MIRLLRKQPDFEIRKRKIKWFEHVAIWQRSGWKAEQVAQKNKAGEMDKASGGRLQQARHLFGTCERDASGSFDMADLFMTLVTP